MKARYHVVRAMQHPYGSTEKQKAECIQSDEDENEERERQLAKTESTRQRVYWMGQEE